MLIYALQAGGKCSYHSDPKYQYLGLKVFRQPAFSLMYSQKQQLDAIITRPPLTPISRIYPGP